MPSEEQKPTIDVPAKSSMEILSELFNSFDAEPPVIVKKEKLDSPSKKLKKAKKKHKHKDKKHKKKDKKRRRESSSSSEKSEIDLAEILIKQEKESNEQRIKIEGTDLTFNLKTVKKENEIKQDRERVNDEGTISNIDTKVKVEPYESTGSYNVEEGEISHSDPLSSEKRKRKHKHKSDDPKSKKKKKEERPDDLRNRIKHSQKERERKTRSRSHSKSKDRSTSKNRESRHKEDNFYRSRDRERERDRETCREHKSRDRDKYDYKSKRNRGTENSFYREKEDDFWGRDRYRSYDRDRRHRDRSNSRDSSYIDKKKLLEIARKNAIQMMKSGSLPGALTLGPQAQEKVIAAIKAGGKTIEELTDFCKTLSKKEELGELSSNSDASESDTDKPFHHPFQIKDRPTSITMNIKNSVPLPIKSTVERTSELRLQFPVSSGQLHRKTENEWVPVSPKKPELVSAPSKTSVAPLENAPLAIEAPKNDETEQKTTTEALVPTIDTNGVDIGSIVSQRLTAIRRLQENPNDVQALTQMYKVNKEMQSWAESKQQPGQFTGTTGAQVLSQAELSSGYQAWAKKDQLTSATPVSGGMGMHLLQKMGWKPGEGLGKEKSGTLEPLLLEVKLDKKGLVANEEQKKKTKKQNVGQGNIYSIQNKHPVSLLGEYASKKKLGAPQYNLCFECGPDHKKNFLFKVILNGVEYKPNVASPNKKEAKAAAASVCLQHLGLLSQPPPLETSQ